jgi:hypothetical protein
MPTQIERAASFSGGTPETPLSAPQHSLNRASTEAEQRLKRGRREEEEREKRGRREGEEREKRLACSWRQEYASALPIHSLNRDTTHRALTEAPRPRAELRSRHASYCSCLSSSTGPLHLHIPIPGAPDTQCVCFTSTQKPCIHYTI